jgi:translation initiation factor 5B
MIEFEPINPNLIDSEPEEETNPLNPNQTGNKDKKKKKKNKSKNVKSIQSTQSQTQSKPISAMGKLIAERKRLQEEEDERIRKLEEEEERKIKEEEERLAEIKRKEEEEKEKKRKAKQDKIEAQKKAGTYKTKAEKERDKKNQLRLEQMRKQGIITDDGRIIMKQTNINKIVSNESETESETNKINEINNVNQVVEESNNFRCPIFTIMGHVDTGKTTLLDYLRNTSVQSHEAGGITQQIGATLLTPDVIAKQIKSIESTSSNNLDIKIPGLLLVDTPGHEAFKVLRKLGSKLADIAIVIIDIMHGLEPQTIESINLLKESNSPFMFALNKIDRLYGWKNNSIEHSMGINMGIDKQIENQDFNTREEFNSRYRQIQTQIMSQGINCELFWSNQSPSDTVNIIPISGITGQGIPDLLSNIISYSQTTLKDSLQWVERMECIVMEITNTDGYGYTIDCILRNGQLSRGNWINISTSSGTQIKTQIKNILTIPANRDSKFISQSKYIQHQSIKGACQIKIVAPNLESSQIGSQIILETDNIQQMDNKIEQIEQIKEQSNDVKYDDAKEDDKNLIVLDSQGICIFTSTRGSMESFIQFARTNPELISPIKISHISIGNVNKKELTKFDLANKANSSNGEPIPEYQCVLAFEVEIDKEAVQYAKDNGITIFKDETIYRLCNQYRDFANKLYTDRKERMRELTVFPCILKIIESNIFNKKNPLVMGVEVQEGTLHLGTPLIIESKIYIGKVVGIQVNKQDVKIGKKGQQVCVKIDNQSNPGIMYGRHFTHKDLLYSNVSRESVDILKQYFKTDVSKEDVGLLVKLKKMFGF